MKKDAYIAKFTNKKTGAIPAGMVMLVHYGKKDKDGDNPYKLFKADKGVIDTTKLAGWVKPGLANMPKELQKKETAAEMEVRIRAEMEAKVRAEFEAKAQQEAKAAKAVTPKQEAPKTPAKPAPNTTTRKKAVTPKK